MNKGFEFFAGAAVAAGAAIVGYFVGKDAGRREARKELDDDYFDDDFDLEFDEEIHEETPETATEDAVSENGQMDEAEDCSDVKGFTPSPDEVNEESVDDSESKAEAEKPAKRKPRKSEVQE